MVKAEMTWSLNAWAATCCCAPLLVTWTVKLKIPSDEGVPLRRPPEDKVMPEGRFPETTDQVSGSVVDACNCWEYDEFASAFGNGEVVVIVSPV